MVIGRMSISVERLPPTGDRADFHVRVVGPGETDYAFPLSITRTALAVWDRHGGRTDDETIRDELVKTILEIHGTAAAFPDRGYWFDSYNAESTLRETCNKIRNAGLPLFQRDRTISDEVSSTVGADVLSAVDESNAHIIEKYGEELVRSLDLAFEPSEAQDDLGSDPRDKAGFVYRVCILSVIIDRFGLGRPEVGRSAGSLNNLEAWLGRCEDAYRVKAIVQPLRMVKYLRKQYPIHEHYEEDESGQRDVRRDLQQARDYFGFRDGEHAWNWKRVKDSFLESMRQLREI